MKKKCIHKNVTQNFPPFQKKKIRLKSPLILACFKIELPEKFAGKS